MKKISAKVWYWVILITALVMMVASMYSCSQSVQRESRLLNNVKVSQDSVKLLVDQNHDLVGQVQSISVTVDELKQQGDVLGVDNNRLKQQVGNLNNLVSYYKGKIKSQDTVVSKGRDTTITVVIHGDTTMQREKVFGYSNKYLTLNQLYNPTTDLLTTSYSYMTGFELTVYKRRDHPFNIFSPKRLKADLRLEDPNATLINAKSIVIQNKKSIFDKWWFWTGVGLIGGVFIAK